MKHVNANLQLTAQDRFGLALTARLSEAADVLPHDISERLRAARMQALGQQKLVKTVGATTIQASGGAASLTFGDDEVSTWRRLASIIPLLALMAGLVCIYILDNDRRAKELAEIDSAILIDDLPPAAYTDPGFAQFLQIRRDQSE